MSTPRKTVYVFYATFNDAIRLYRSARRKGYSYGEIEPLPDDDPNVSIRSHGMRIIKDADGNKMEYPHSRYLVPKKHVVFFYKRKLPNVLIYGDYQAKTLNQPDFELYKVTLTREY